MSSIYPRGEPGRETLWLAFLDAAGKRRCVSTGYRLGLDPRENERALLKAEEMARALERKVAEQHAAAATGPMTLLRYATEWIARRRRRNISTVGDDEARLRDHVLPALGLRPLSEIRPPEIRVLFRELMDAGALAPKTIRNVYGTLHCLFADAVAEELRDASPCVLTSKRRELPEKEDKDPTWRAQAIYTMSEARQLCLDPSIAPWRRVLYAVLFFAALRIGEAVQRRWRDYEPEQEPLGSLAVVSAWNTKHHRETGTKTRRARSVPVHPELARVLAAWKLSGWGALMGRPPTPEDLLFPVADRWREAAGSASIPPPTGSASSSSFEVEKEDTRPRSSKAVLNALKRDCRRLGFRERRIHDTRRSFISWARGAGANDGILRWVTHGAGKRTILDDYTTPPWPDLCSQVLVLRLDLRSGLVLPVTARHQA